MAEVGKREVPVDSTATGGGVPFGMVAIKLLQVAQTGLVQVASTSRALGERVRHIVDGFPPNGENPSSGDASPETAAAPGVTRGQEAAPLDRQATPTTKQI